MRTTRIVTIGLCLALALGACGKERAIAAADLARIMPGATEAPAGTQFRADQSGPQELKDFVSETEVETKLRSLGFRGAYVSTFTTANLADDLNKAPSGSQLFGAFAILLKDAASAHQGFLFYSERLKAQAEKPAAVLVKNLGAEAVGFRFSRLENAPLPGIAILFRLGNALFSVVAVGNPDANATAARKLARTLNRRARG